MLMPDDQPIYSPKFAKSESWSIENFNTNESKPKRVIRRFINSAIYVEKPIKHIMPPLRKKSPIFLHSISENECFLTSNVQEAKAKIMPRSYTSPKLHLCHESEGKCSHLKNKQSTDNISTSSVTNSGSDEDSQITVKTKKPILSKLGPEIRISLTSLFTERTGEIDFTEKEEVIQNWLNRKDQEKKKKLLEEIKIKEEKEKERLLLLEKERENFKKWLTDKKAKDEMKKKMKEKEEDVKQLQEAEKEKRRVENELCFNMWLKRKKRLAIEREINQKLTLLQIFEDKQRRMQDNEQAFRDWVKNSRNKPKPLPPNQGLKSLCSSTSVTYINPVPWIPNIEILQKPASQ